MLPYSPFSRLCRLAGWAALLTSVGFLCDVAEAADFSGSIVLGRPTDTTITANLLSPTPVVVYLEYGSGAGTYSSQSAALTLNADAPQEVTLSGLAPTTRYYYRVRHRTPTATTFDAGVECSFVTQRAVGRSFTFAIEADPHHQDNEPNVWLNTLANIAADQPDFLIDLGDTFMDEKFGATTSAQLMQSHHDVRTGFFSVIGRSVPIFLVNGNHDPELGWMLSLTSPLQNVATWGMQARQYYFPCPTVGSFYSGDTTPDIFSVPPHDGYYAFTWGDALFVVLDPFWNTCPGVAKAKDPWSWTLGKAQYDWLKRTLEQSQATFKFVFLHNLVGGSADGIARGGVEVAPYYEWGGQNLDGSSGFATKRPGWAMPIQDLLLANHVSVVFHGHDHLYVKQDLDPNGDGVPELIYQEVPQPSRSNQTTGSAAGYGYRSGVMYPSSGHIRVQVTATQATFEYVRSVVSSDTRAGVPNGTVMHRYTLAAPAGGSGAASRLSGLSVRASAGTGDQTLITGFGVGGGGALPLLVRGVGPTLTVFGVADALADPVLSVVACDGANLASNDDWADANNAAQITVTAAQVGAFALPAASRDAAILSAVSPGLYSAQVSGKASSSGVALVEVYDASPAGSAARLTNLSARAQVGTGEGVLIAGFAINGSTAKRLLIRGVGPALGGYGVGHPISDPQLAIYRQGDGQLLAQNNDWGSASTAPALVTAAVQVGAFALPDGSNDAALVALLNPGVYSAQVSGVAGATGIGLVEIYELP